jgi:hypothetical protein
MGVFCPGERRERTEIIPTEPEAGNTDEGSEPDFQKAPHFSGAFSFNPRACFQRV